MQNSKIEESGFNVDALLGSLADQVAERVGKRLSESNNATIRPRLFTVDQAAVYLGRSKTSLQHLIAERTIPVVRHDRRVFLDRVDLDEWIDAAKS